jgi:hypothetical protein
MVFSGDENYGQERKKGENDELGRENGENSSHGGLI